MTFYSRTRVIRNKIALWLLKLPLDTPGLMLPGTIRFPENTPVTVDGFYFLALSPKTIAIQSKKGKMIFFGGPQCLK
jgi:hypothetical protein